jgi:hypothetical protein
VLSVCQPAGLRAHSAVKALIGVQVLSPAGHLRRDPLREWYAVQCIGRTGQQRVSSKGLQ